MAARKITVGWPACALPVLAAVSIAALTAPVRAEVRITGRADALVVEARGAPVAEILAALGASFDFKYRTTTALSRVVNGRYAGPLPRVVARLLDGYDYVTQSSPAGVSVVIFAPGLASRTPAVRTAATAGHADVPLSGVPGQAEGWNEPSAAATNPAAAPTAAVVAMNEEQSAGPPGQPEGWSDDVALRTVAPTTAPASVVAPASAVAEEQLVAVPGRNEGWDGQVPSRPSPPGRVAVTPPVAVAAEEPFVGNPGQPEDWDGVSSSSARVTPGRMDPRARGVMPAPGDDQPAMNPGQTQGWDGRTGSR